VLSPNIGGEQQIEEMTLSIPSISKEQYANWEGLAKLLRNLNSKQSNQAYELMVGMVNDAKKKDAKSYLAKAEEITNLFSKFSKEEKELVNHFFASKNASIRI
jgi:dsDNA-specific endonuclease/ATPase MutS2